MYREFIFLIFDYFNTIKKNVFYYEWVIPFVIGVMCFVLLNFNWLKTDYSLFINSSVSLLGVLLGFSIMVITILTTSNNDNIEKIKKTLTDYIISNEKISLYRLLLVNYSYLIIIEALVLVAYFISLLFFSSFCHTLKLFLFSFYVITIIHILLLTIRNITDFYFIITKEKNNNSVN